jgi:hypothetical protein
LGLTVAVVGGLLGLLFFAALSAVTLLQGAALVIIGIACVAANIRLSVFFGCGVAATILIIGAIGEATAYSWTELKGRYPFESMSERLSYEARALRYTQIGPQERLTMHPESTLMRLDNAEKHGRRSFNLRSKALRLVHAGHVEQFIVSPGFGVGRMPRPSPYSIERGDRRATFSYKLDHRSQSADNYEAEGDNSPGEAISNAASIFGDAIGELHDEARLDFVDPDGFGFIRDRDHVAGFVPHGFLSGWRGFWPKS